MNAKQIYRLDRDLGLQLRNKVPKRRVKAKLRDDRRPAQRANETWATDNAFMESLNGKLRAECLNAQWFMSLDDARAKCEAWRRDDNEVWPHSGIGNKPPASLVKSVSGTQPTLPE